MRLRRHVAKSVPCGDPRCVWQKYFGVGKKTLVFGDGNTATARSIITKQAQKQAHDRHRAGALPSRIPKGDRRHEE
ncbi:hypothetical protein shim_17940 [Shimia sp. SK013]|nr:hypothetical protein shim_17940 [Shimia sp. SK013]